MSTGTLGAKQAAFKSGTPERRLGARRIERSTRVLFFAVTTLLISQSTALASKNFILVSNSFQVNKILKSIPARENNLGILLLSYGLTVESVLISEPDESEIMDGTASVRRGDRFIDINLTEPLPRLSECQLFQPISFTFRSGRYLPKTTTANFLSTGKCESPVD